MAEQVLHQKPADSSIMYNAIWSGAGQVIGFASAFISSIVLARWLGPEARGLYALIAATSILLADLFSATAIVHAFSFLTGKRKYSLPTLAGHALSLSIVGSILLGVLAAIAPISLIHIFAPELGRIHLWITVAWTLQLLMINMLSGILIGLNRIRTMIIISTSSIVLTLGFQVVFLVILNMGLEGAVLQILATAAFNYAMFAYLIMVDIRGVPTLDRDVARDLASYTSRNYPSYIGSQLLARTDIYFITLYVGPAAAGVYAIARGLAEIISIIDLPITNAVLPQVVTSDRTKAAILIGQAFAFSFWGSALLGLVGASTSFIFIPLLYGNDFADAIGLYIVLLIGSLALSSRTIHHYFLASLGKPEIPTYVMISTGILSLPTLAILTATFDEMGAAVGYSFLASMRAIVISAIFLKMTNQPVSLLFRISRTQLTDGYYYTVHLFREKFKTLCNNKKNNQPQPKPH
ncbi:MAG: hypothetical protein CUN55_11690 [Phototrophicales bacterium]|nr:MAG: hypothetical protein CUN55_11690 [Phototrophicales bacterium]